jgi:hypothetical protein
MVYYDIPVNETSSNLVQTYDKATGIIAQGTDFTKVLAANLLTVRMQVKF